jgi:hypothetical protein
MTMDETPTDAPRFTIEELVLIHEVVCDAHEVPAYSRDFRNKLVVIIDKLEACASLPIDE